MEEIVKIFNELANEPSRTGKEAILEKYKGNELFRYTLNFLYNPFIVTGISTKKLNKKVEPYDVSTMGNDFSRINQLMAYLRWSNRGSDYDIYVIQNFINKQDSDEVKEFIGKVVTKSLKVGISDKTINKVYGKGVIPNFAVMLAESYEKKESKVAGNFYITQKLDGNRCIAIKDEGEVKFFTRKGQPIEGVNDLIRQVMLFPDGTVLDGEILLINKNNLPADELFRATQKIVRKDGVKKDLEFYVFDSVSLKEFKDGISINTYEDRRGKLESLFSLFGDDLNLVKLLPTLYRGDDKNMVAVLMKYAEEQGWEGLMVNTADGLYKTKRTSDLLKVKHMKTADLLVMGMEEGAGRNEGRLGAILVEYKGGITKVGSGFTDKDRDYFWENQDEIVGKIVEIQFFEESMDEKTKQPSLRFPIFKCVRTDKDIEDINYGE